MGLHMESPGASGNASGAAIETGQFQSLAYRQRASAASAELRELPEPWPYLGSPEERAKLFRKELLRAALRYAEKGLPVFPVDGQKKPLVRWGKGEDGHPDLTKRRATTDPETVRAWWARWPLAMIGMRTGAPSGIVVLDVDTKNGVDGLANLRAIGIDPYSLSPAIAITPSGGLHVYLRYNGQLRNSAGLLAEGVDIRGNDGYVVLPPSLPSIGSPEYQWEGGSHGCF